MFMMMLAWATVLFGSGMWITTIYTMYIVNTIKKKMSREDLVKWIGIKRGQEAEFRIVSFINLRGCLVSIAYQNIRSILPTSPLAPFAHHCTLTCY